MQFSHRAVRLALPYYSGTLQFAHTMSLHDWIPEPTILHEVAEKLRNNTALAIKDHNKVDYPVYLAHVLAYLVDEQDDVRAFAGRLIINDLILAIRQSSLAAGTYLKAAVLHALHHSSSTPHTRATTLELLGTILIGVDEKYWPDCPQQLCSALESDHVDFTESILDLLKRWARHFQYRLDSNSSRQQSLVLVFANTLSIIDHNSSTIRVNSLATLTYLISNDTYLLLPYIDNFITALLRHHANSDTSLKNLVAQAFASLLSSKRYLEMLLPYVATRVGEIMLSYLKEDSPVIVLQSMRFWLNLVQSTAVDFRLISFLPRLIPLLLRAMTFDRTKLWLYDSPEHPQKSFDCTPDDSTTNDADYCNLPQDALNRWCVRKSAADLLDCLAQNHCTDISKITIDTLTDKLASDDWLQRELATLLAGAMACTDFAREHLLIFVPTFIAQLEHAPALLKETTCWTLTRLSRWYLANSAVFSEHLEQNDNFLAILHAILGRFHDRHLKVRQAAYGAVADLGLYAKQNLVPYTDIIVPQLIRAFDDPPRTTNTIVVLYDALHYFAEAAGPTLRSHQHATELLLILSTEWSLTPVDDTSTRDGVVALLRATSAVVNALDTATIAESHVLVCARAIDIIRECLLRYQAWKQDPATGVRAQPDEWLLTYGFALLSSLSSVAGFDIAPRFTGGDDEPDFVSLVYLCLTHQTPPVRQAAYGLLGDLAIHAFPLLKPHLPAIVKVFLRQLDAHLEHGEQRDDPVVHHRYTSHLYNREEDSIRALANACWAVSEVVVQHSEDDITFRPLVLRLLAKATPLLAPQNFLDQLRLNVADLVRRVALIHPEYAAPLLPEFVRGWLDVISKMVNATEKGSMFLAFFSTVLQNPTAIDKCLRLVCQTFLAWGHPPTLEIDTMFEKILQDAQCRDPASWQLQISLLDTVSRRRLSERYDL
ncbi:ARM repeat-containing protein [Panus rudis PR-1116 ss-1]|nr:ARM repeat-containing protein [Panus rudis PR-1116 ss-1]